MARREDLKEVHRCQVLQRSRLWLSPGDEIVTKLFMQHLTDIFDRLAAAIPAFKNLAKACANPAIASWLALPQPEAEVRLLDLFLYHLYPFLTGP